MYGGLRRGGHYAPLVALLLGGMLAGCGSTAPSDGTPTTVTIGVLAHAGSRSNPTDADAVRGAQLAVDLVNRPFADVPMSLAAATGLPGLRGATLSLAIAETGSETGKASTAVNSLIESGARALVISDRADVAAAAGSQAQRLKVPLIDAASTADYITELGMDWYFRTVPTDRSLAEAALALVRRQIDGGTARIGLVAEAGGQSAASAALVRDLVLRAGHAVVMERTAAGRGEASSAETAQAVAGNRCDLILALATTPETAAGFFELGAQLIAPIPVIGLGGGFDAADRVRDSVPAALRTASWSAELARRTPVGKAVTDIYERQYGGSMTVEAANAFTATMALALAIDAAGSSDPATIRGALRQLTLPATQMIMPWNGIRFDADGQNRLAAAVVEGAGPAGFRVVYPRELATGPVVWTGPQGSPR